MRRARQAVKGLMPVRRHVPKSVASVVFVSLPVVERVPPLIFRLVTMCRNARFASLLSGGTAGSRTKTNNSCRCFAIRVLNTRLQHARLGVRCVDHLQLSHERPLRLLS